MSVHGPGLTAAMHANLISYACLNRAACLALLAADCEDIGGAKNTCSKIGRTTHAKAGWLLGRIRVLSRRQWAGRRTALDCPAMERRPHCYERAQTEVRFRWARCVE